MPIDHEIEPLSEAASALLDAERNRPDPPVEFGSAVWSRVAFTVALSPIPPVLPATPAPAPTPASAAATATTGVATKVVIGKLVAAVLGASVGGVGLYIWRHGKVAVETAPATVEMRSMEMPKAQPAPTTLAPRTDAPPSPRKAPATLAVPLWASSKSISRQESALLEQARGALLRGEPRAALVAVDEHQQRFPAGQLLEFREAIRIEALVRLGERERAERLAVAFRRRFPHSVFLVGIDQALRGP